MKERKMKALLLDVMMEDRFVCQLRYTKRGFPVHMGGGKIVESYDLLELEAFVREKRPSLAGQQFRICFSEYLIKQ